MKRYSIFTIAMALVTLAWGQQSLEFTKIDYPDATLTIAGGINSQGDIVGSYQDATGYRGFLLPAGVDPAVADNWKIIEVTGALSVRPQAINADGEIVGQYVAADGKWHGFLMSSGTLRTVDPEGSTGATWSGAYGINPQGEVAGAFSDTSGILHGYLLRDGVFTLLPDAVEGSTWSSPTGINARGDILGMFVGPGDPKMYGYLLRKGRFTTLDIQSATAMVCGFAINSAGDIVGHYWDTKLHGFIWANGASEPTPIDDFIPGAFDTEAIGINNRGDVVGDYTGGDGLIHGFLLRRAVPK